MNSNSEKKQNRERERVKQQKKKQREREWKTRTMLPIIKRIERRKEQFLQEREDEQRERVES